MEWLPTVAVFAQVQLFCREIEIMFDTLLKPQPRVSLLTKPYWDAVTQEELLIQQCQFSGCEKYVFYPRVCCPYCQSANLRWVQSSGSGTIITNTTIHRPHHDGFSSQCPYVFAAIELAEGPCIYGKISEGPIDVSLVGRAVKVAFESHGPNQKIPIFVLV